MSKLRTFLRLPRYSRGLVLEAFLLTGVAFLMTRLSPFRWHRRFFGRPSRPANQVEVLRRDAVVGRGSMSGMHQVSGDITAAIPIAIPARIRWALAVVNRYWPWDGTCLLRALAGRWMLLRRGYPSTLYIGARRNSDDTMMFHAWLLQEEIPITGLREARGFVVLTGFE